MVATAGMSIDITGVEDLRTAARQSDQRWRSLVELSPMGVAVVDANGVIAYANPRARVLVAGAGGAVVEGRPFSDVLDGVATRRARRLLRQLLDGGAPEEGRRGQLRRLDGSTAAFEISASAITFEGRPAVQLAMRDVTDQARAEEATRRSERRFRALFDHSPVAIGLCDDQIRWLEVNPAMAGLVGATTAELVGTRAVAAIDHPALAGGAAAARRSGDDGPAGTGGDAVELQVRRRDGTQRWASCTITFLHRTRREGWALVMAQDITEAKGVEVALRRFATTDPLTGALNRRAWDAELASLVDSRRDDDTPLTVALIDLDYFKAYNDTYGHAAGDDLLRQFAGASRSCLRRSDVFARWGGEEFILALPGCPPEEADAILERIRASVPAGRTCSIGVTTWQAPELTSATVARADRALYRAKDGGRDRVARA